MLAYYPSNRKRKLLRFSLLESCWLLVNGCRTFYQVQCVESFVRSVYSLGSISYSDYCDLLSVLSDLYGEVIA